VLHCLIQQGKGRLLASWGHGPLPPSPKFAYVTVDNLVFRSPLCVENFPTFTKHLLSFRRVFFQLYSMTSSSVTTFNNLFYVELRFWLWPHLSSQIRPDPAPTRFEKVKSRTSLIKT